MKTSETQAAFAALLDTFEPISGQPTDNDLTRLRIKSLSVLVPIPFDRQLGKHSLMGLILSNAKCEARHDGLTFPSYKKRPAIYDTTIADDTKAGVRAKAKAVHQAKLEDWKFFDCAQRELRTFILSCVDDTWIHELKDPITGYDHVPPHGIMEHIWKSCSGLHSIDVLSLRTKMMYMHEDTTGIPEYINALEDAKKRSERADSAHAFTEHNLMLVAVRALFTTQQFPSAIEKWEDLTANEKNVDKVGRCLQDRRGQRKSAHPSDRGKGSIWGCSPFG